jgi:hypothetical protein
MEVGAKMRVLRNAALALFWCAFAVAARPSTAARPPPGKSTAAKFAGERSIASWMYDKFARTQSGGEPERVHTSAAD